MIKYFKILTLTLICFLNFYSHSMEKPKTIQFHLYSPILQAVKEGDIENVKQLLLSGKKPDEDKDNRGRTALFLSVIKHAEIFNKVISVHTAIINQAKLMQRPIAEEEKNNFLVELFKQSGIDIYNKIISLLLDAGANVNARDIKGNTPLVFATGKGDLPLVDLLVRYIEQ